MKNLREKLFSSLTKKFALAIVIVLLAAGSAFIFVAKYTGYKLLEQQSHTKANIVAELSETIMEHLMIEGKNDRVKNLLKLVVNSHQAEDALVLKRDGTVILSAKPGFMPQRLQLEKFKELKGSIGSKFLSVKKNGSHYEYILKPIIKKPECYKCHKNDKTEMGYFAVKISMDDINASTQQHQTINILMTVVMFAGLGGVIFGALLLLVIRPVRELRAQIQQIEDQIDKVEEGSQIGFSQVKIPAGSDEIAGLITSFNKLIQRLNRAHAKLNEVYQAQLAQADRLTTAGEMAASIAHEIKNPLTGALGALQLITDDMSDADSCHEIMNEIIVQLERINHAVNDLLSYAKPAEPFFEKTNLNEIINRTLSLLKPQLANGKINIKLKLEKNIPDIIADQKLLQQLFWNILLNAVQAMQEGGTLSVITAADNLAVKIIVKDTGKGIPQEYSGKIYKPFFTMKHKGTGLGLAISKRIVDQHSGSISLESEIGKGTSFTIMLPISHGRSNSYEG